MNDEIRQIIQQAIWSGERTQAEVAAQLGISPYSLSRALLHQGKIPGIWARLFDLLGYQLTLRRLLPPDQEETAPTARDAPKAVKRVGVARTQLRLTHTAAQLWTAHHACEFKIERRRLKFIAHLADGYTREQAMAFTGYSLPSALRCIDGYNALGLAGLHHARKFGKRT